MIFLFLGLIITILGLYFLPGKEASLSKKSKNTPKWFYLVFVLWIINWLFYIPYLGKIFMEGLVSLGYLNEYTAVGSWVLLVGSFILYGLLYNIYLKRLRLEEAKHV